jgi:mRNA-degrading endonuclease RelE of RelBE toxin-antitoxin system
MLRTVAASFQILLTEGASMDLEFLEPFLRRRILDGVELHLRFEPKAASRRIKAMRPNPIASWELRLGDYRVLYDVDEDPRVVTVQVIGEKRGNRLIVRNQEYTLHESHRP